MHLLALFRDFVVEAARPFGNRSGFGANGDVIATAANER
jgi:hypothetical protein